MPNHITNCLEISHKSKAKMKWLSEVVIHKVIDEDETKVETEIFDFNVIIPQPDGMNQDPLSLEDRKTLNWYDWNCEHWGTKWNAYSFQWHGKADHCIAIQFDTAWSPPEPVLDKLVEMGFVIAGIWKDEGDPSVNDFYNDCGNWYSTITFDYFGLPKEETNAAGEVAKVSE